MKIVNVCIEIQKAEKKPDYVILNYDNRRRLREECRLYYHSPLRYTDDFKNEFIDGVKIMWSTDISQDEIVLGYSNIK